MIQYSSRGGLAQVAVIACEAALGKRLGLFTKKSEDSWILRDYIGGRILKSESNSMTAAQVEAQVTYSEAPAVCSVQRKDRWRADLDARSRAYFGAQNYDPTSPPNAAFGKWKKL